MTIGFTPHLTPSPTVCTWDDLKALCAEDGVCTSIFLDAYHFVGAGSGTRPERVRLRTILGEIDRYLHAGHLPDSDRVALLDPLWHVLAHLETERDLGHSDAIAWLRSTHSLFQFRLPWHVEDAWSVEGRFRVKPLLRFLSPRRRFHVLALARNNVRLLEGSETGCSTVPSPPGMPHSLDQFTAFDQPDHAMTNVSSAGPGHGQMSGVQFGTSSANEKLYRHEHDLYRRVERAMEPLLRAKPWPLVLAGTEEELALYRTVNGYQDLVTEPVMTSPDSGLSDHELGRIARDVVNRWRSKDERHALAKLAEASGTARASTNTAEVVQAAATGRVLHLFLQDGRDDMGDLYKLTGQIPEIELLAAPEDLVNAAVVETIRHGGNVWQTATDLDAPAALAAVFRY